MTKPATDRKDVLGGAITVASILLFLATGSAALSRIVASYMNGEASPDQTLIIALLLNVALILFGWWRHRDLTREVLERAAAEERANALASKDPLTGFLNRRSLADEGSAMVIRADRRKKAVALMMLDLDHFKTVNDMHGHTVGDALLRAVAAEIFDTLPESALAARFGGDEFACAMLFDPSNPDSVERIAERLVSRMTRPFLVDGRHLHITASVGIARSDGRSTTIDALLRAADIALYSAKNAGRNRHTWFDVSMERELQVRNEVEGALRLAVPRGEVVPYFDPQIDMTTGRLTGFEVLARWEHPQRGLVEAESFLPIAEETGMIADLSLSVMRQAFVAASDWHHTLTLAVNVSPTQLKDAWLAQKIIKLLTETGFPPSRLEVEITESALFENMALAQSIIASLKNQGIKLALDDFGTGYSSLAHLRALPFDRIKIDKSFVMSINQNPESAAIVNAIARLGDSLNLAITAEGIEDKATEERLRAMGCARGQGHCFGGPQSMANARCFLADRRLLVPTSGDFLAEQAIGRRLAG